MRHITISLSFTVLFLLTCALLEACSAYSPQQIKRDADQWYPYNFRIDDDLYRIKIPPKGLIIKKPVTYISADSVDDYFIAASFGFDYGRGTYNDIAQVEVSVSISRIDDGISCIGDRTRFGNCILQDAKASTTGNINRYRRLGELQWFHESDIQTPWDAYSIMLGENHYLTIEGHYWRDLVARPGMLADRRKLVEEIVSSVRKLQ